MNGITTVNTFIHCPSLSCVRVMHFQSAFHCTYIAPNIYLRSYLYCVTTKQRNIPTENKGSYCLTLTVTISTYCFLMSSVYIFWSCRGLFTAGEHKTSASFFQEYSEVIPSRHWMNTSVMLLNAALGCPALWSWMACRCPSFISSSWPIAIQNAWQSAPTKLIKSINFGGSLNRPKSV